MWAAGDGSELSGHRVLLPESLALSEPWGWWYLIPWLVGRMKPTRYTTRLAAGHPVPGWLGDCWR